jgi:HTH-type transcriptional regulator/antitoxin HigA
MMKTTLIVIENNADHTQAKAWVDRLMASNDPANAAKIAAQARLIEAYECNRWPRKAPGLPDVLTYLLDQNDLTRADLSPLLGGASRVSEVLSGKRKLSMTMIQRLRERFHVPADVLMPPRAPRARKRIAA